MRHTSKTAFQIVVKKACPRPQGERIGGRSCYAHQASCSASLPSDAVLLALMAVAFLPAEVPKPPAMPSPQAHPGQPRPGGQPAAIPGGRADRPDLAQAWARGRGAGPAAAAAVGSGLVQSRQVGRHHVADGEPARAQRSGRVHLQPFPFIDRAQGLQFRRLQSIPTTTRSPRSSACTMDKDKRQELVVQAQEIIAADQPYAYLVYPLKVYAFDKTVLEGGFDGRAGGSRHQEHLVLPRAPSPWATPRT